MAVPEEEEMEDKKEWMCLPGERKKWIEAAAWIAFCQF